MKIIIPYGVCKHNTLEWLAKKRKEVQIGTIGKPNYSKLDLVEQFLMQFHDLFENCLLIIY